MPYKSNRKQLENDFKRWNDAGVETVAQSMVKVVKALLNRKASNNGQPRSKPGQPPAKETGTLGRSITTQRVVLGQWVVGTNLNYAPYLELGTKNMQPRPFMLPGIKAVKPRSLELYKIGFKQAMGAK